MLSDILRVVIMSYPTNPLYPQFPKQIDVTSDRAKRFSGAGEQLACRCVGPHGRSAWGASSLLRGSLARDERG